MQNDLQLIEDLKKKSKSAFEKLYILYSGKMKGVAYKYVGNKTEAEDVLHDAFIKVHDNISMLKDNSLFEGWLRRIVVNQALDLLKSKVKIKEIISEAAHLGSDEETDEENPYEGISSKEIMETLDKLPIGYKTIFYLCVIDGYQHKEVAEQLGISESTSKSQLTRARVYFRKLLNEKVRVGAESIK